MIWLAMCTNGLAVPILHIPMIHTTDENNRNHRNAIVLCFAEGDGIICLSRRLHLVVSHLLLDTAVTLLASALCAIHPLPHQEMSSHDRPDCPHRPSPCAA